MECSTRTNFTLTYIAAGNEVIEAREKAKTAPSDVARDLASALVQRALNRRKTARRVLLQHCDEHGC